MVHRQSPKCCGEYCGVVEEFGLDNFLFVVAAADCEEDFEGNGKDREEQ